MLVDRCIIASPTECAAAVVRYQAVGVQELIERFGCEVLPRFATG